MYKSVCDDVNYCNIKGQEINDARETKKKKDKRNNTKPYYYYMTQVCVLRQCRRIKYRRKIELVIVCLVLLDMLGHEGTDFL